MILMVSEFLNELEARIPAMFGDKCLLNGLETGDIKIKEPEYFPTTNRSDEQNIQTDNLPCYTLEWQNRTMPDNFQQIVSREGDLKIRVFSLKARDELKDTRNYLQDALDIIWQGFVGEKYREVLGYLGEIKMLTSILSDLPGHPDKAVREMQVRMIIN